jgi:hypothetical protein
MTVPEYHSPKDPFAVKAYNHEPIGNGKPVISNKEFKEVLERIDAGERQLIIEVENSYGLDETQQTLLNNRK